MQNVRRSENNYRNMSSSRASDPPTSLALPHVAARPSEVLPFFDLRACSSQQAGVTDRKIALPVKSAERIQPSKSHGRGSPNGGFS